ncbi:putative disease resistance protein [Cinnamomum micranthum f. kanehirae]|uniref:Putative disease resistance protein n=1 Tax=Cinnamomum micranthum f. kanehirae TaxID=337451 RepID=A0A3S3MYC7_9MAGN|nr:putative disease resistance protein [Cinnamomum micranthum f. kanehirae]
MAQAAVGVFLNKLYEMIEKEAHLLIGASHDVRLLRDSLQWLSLFLEEADAKCLQDKKVHLWVTQLREATFEAEDVMDKFVLQIELPRRRAGFRAFIRNPINRWMALHVIGKAIQNINSRLENISLNQSKLGLGNVLDKAESLIPVRKQKRVPRVEEVDVVGIEEEAEVVSKLLIDGDARRSVVSIVGMGGLGKTTLAKKVSNDINVKMNFRCFAWIYVSQEFVVCDLLIDMIKCVKTFSSKFMDKLKSMSDEELKMKHNDKLKSMSEEELRMELFNCLRGRRYLIVIDDIWNREAWDGIEASFPNENNGSRIMLTTRKRDVALYAEPRSKPYELRLLTNEECWELLSKKAFLEVANHGDFVGLEKVGKEIARKCCGLPLAAVILGGLLSRKEQSVYEWERVLNGIGWHLKEGEDQILGILALSYNDLPYHLKMCFLYVAAFPGDSSVRTTELLRMWVAEGFVKERGDVTMEDVAEDYLMELIHRSLIQVVERRFNGRVKKCRIHDLLRDLAIQKAMEHQFLDVCSGNASPPPTTARRLSITHDICEHISLNYVSKHLRSFLCFIQLDAMLEKGNWKSLYGRLRLLRVMHIHNVCISTVPDGIGDLIFLRYLSMRLSGGTFLAMLPSTISNLYNLQTLIILRDDYDVLLPEHGIWKLRQLRHLHIHFGCSPSKSKHPKLNELTNLQSLSVIRVGQWITGDFDKLTSLRSLKIQGTLSLYQIALSNFIGKQKNLESLHLDGHLKWLPALQDSAISLTKLVLKFSKLSEDSMAALEKLPKLQLLKLLNGSYEGKKMCCSVRAFPVLVVLEINSCTELEDWTVEEGAFSNLRRLKIRMCSELKMIPEGFRRVTTLQELVLSMQPRNFRERVRENGLDWFKIKHVPSILVS